MASVRNGGVAMERSLAAEFIGTFWLVLGGCGSAVISAAFPELGIGIVGVAFAFGLTVLTMAYAFGGISGAHFNPAVTLGLVVAGKFEASRMPWYWAAQVAGSIVAAVVLYVIVSDKVGFTGVGSFASNGFGAASPGGFGFTACLVTEVVMTAAFLIIILGATSEKVPAGFAPIAIGLGLTLVHLFSVPVTNASVNPARSTGVALFADAPALAQLWFFWLTPLAGAALGAIIWRAIAAPAPIPTVPAAPA